MNDDRTTGLGGPDYRTETGARAQAFAAPTAVMPAMKRVSWGAIAAGAVVALVCQLALTLAGFAFGLGQVNPASEAGWERGLGVATGVWVGVSTIVSLFFGGICAGRLAGVPRRPDSALHGLVTWGVVTLASFWLMSTAIGQLAGGAATLVGDLATAGGAAGLFPEDLSGQELRDLAPGAGTAPPVDPARAEDVAGRIGRASGFAFLAMVLGAGAAALGGYLGRPREVASPMMVRSEVH